MSLPIDHIRLPKPGDIFGGKYRLECILGSGGMGVVFGATHLITHKRVAIKWLAGEPGATLTDTTQRFVREARLAGEFQHPNAVQVYDLGESDGSFYMVMEWLEGESLAARLERVKRLSYEEAIHCLIPCMHAMQRAHDAGIVHRDIKPANIFLCEATSDRPAISKVLDFGISKRITASTDMSSFVTKTGMLVGTPHYLAPEQLRARPVDRRTDIYGFGVLLYQTLAGELPFVADNFGDLIVEISVGTPRSLRELVRDLPVGVEHVVARAMARDPDERFSSLHELIASLNAIDPSPLTAATVPQLRTPPPLPMPSSLRPIATAANIAPPTKKPAWPWLAAGAGAVTLVAAFLWSERDASEPAAIVRPRDLTQTVAVSPEPELLPTAPIDSLPVSTQQLPKLDASVADSGRAIPLEPKPAPEANAKPKPATPRVATKGSEDTHAPRPSATGASTELQPTAAAPVVPELQPTPEPSAPQRNPLHMDIQ